MAPVLTPGQAESIKKLAGDAYYVEINGVSIASIETGGWEDVSV